MDEDLELVKRFRAGDADAFELLVQKHRRAILNLIFRFTGSAHEAEDLAQEVFLRVYRALPGFKFQARFTTWVYRITFNLCMRERSRRARRETRSLDLEKEGGGKELDFLPDPGPPVHDNLERVELRKAVQDAVAALPAEQRAAVILHRFHELSYEEIARVLDLSVPAVKSRLHRARGALRKLLASQLEEPKT